jgi:hypothetical protein
MEEFPSNQEFGGRTHTVQSQAEPRSGSAWNEQDDARWLPNNLAVRGLALVYSTGRYARLNTL